MKEEIQVDRPGPRLAPSRVRRASWGAIFAGMFVSVVIQIMLMLLGTAIGLSTVDPAHRQTPGQGLAIGAGIWLLASGLVSTWIGACVAGRLSGGPQRADGMLHGIVTWSVATVAMLTLLTSAIGNVLGSAGSLLGNALSAGANSPEGQNLAASQSGQDLASSISREIRQALPQTGALLPPTGRTEGQQVPGQLTALMQQDPELATAVSRMEAKGGASKAAPDRDQVVNLLTSKHNLDQAAAQNLVNQWDQQFQQVHAQAAQRARQAGSAAAEGASMGAWWGFGALILGLLVAAWGGWAGAASLPRPMQAATVASS